MPFDLADLAKLIEPPSLLVAQKQLFSKKKYQDDPAFVSVLFNEFDAKGDKPFFSGFEPDKTIIAEQNLFNNLKKIGRYLLDEYERNGRHKWSHADQRRVLEKAIRIFDKADKAGKSDDSISENVNLELGKAFLYRARIIKPKGFTVPAKKIEAINKALDYCQKADDDSAAHLKGLIALERERCDIDFTDDEIAWLEKATKGIDPLDKYKDNIERQIEFYQMRVRLEENGGYYSENIAKIFDFEDTRAGKNNRLELEKLKVALFNSSVSEEMKSVSFKNLCDRLSKTPFSHPLWGDTVRYLKRLYQSKNKYKNTYGKNFAIDIWSVAEYVVHQTSSPHLRWYWSRQRDLYDMAFLAALDSENNKKENPEQDKIKLAAQIADSAKNRPALTWQAMEKMGDEYKEEIQNYAKALGGGYIIFKSASKNKESGGSDCERSEFDFSNVDENMIIVQFYLVHLNKKEENGDNENKLGYTLIYDGQTKKWSYHDFKFYPIWEKYLQWQTAYLDLPYAQKYISASHLKELCCTLGNQMDFLFKFKKIRHIILVPHDFLHRVPIHGAIITEDILLYNFNCSYLPALSYLPQKYELAQDKPVLLQYFDKSKEPDVEKINLFDNIVKHFDPARSTKDASLDDLLEIVNCMPSMLAIHCHGQSDAVNPFFSKLLLKENLLLIQLSAIKNDFAGTDIFLGACETDLMPPLNSPLDEQLSISTMFLNKGPCAVLGTMWEANPHHVKDLLESYFKLNDKSGPMKFNALYHLQKQHWKDFQLEIEEAKNKQLYWTLCFKIYGKTQ